MKIGIIAITRGGRELARKISEKLDNTTLLEKEAGQKVADTHRCELATLPWFYLHHGHWYCGAGHRPPSRR